MVSMVIGNYVSNVMVTVACNNMHAPIGTEQYLSVWWGWWWLGLCYSQRVKE